MAIALTPSGDFATVNGALAESDSPLWQNYESEVRCLQGTYAPDLNFGRNPYVWGLSQSPKDRCADLISIGEKYVVVRSVVYDSPAKTYRIQG